MDFGINPAFLKEGILNVLMGESDMNLLNALGRSASAFTGRRGVRSSAKGLAALAVGRWLYKKWMSSRSQRRMGSLGRI
jgi:hypothetical protein